MGLADVLGVIKKRRSSAVLVTEFDDIARLASMLGESRGLAARLRLTCSLARIASRSSWACHGSS
jgi:hypothetical protein